MELVISFMNTQRSVILCRAHTIIRAKSYEYAIFFFNKLDSIKLQINNKFYAWMIANIL